MELIELLVADTVSFGREVSADVEGVPSMAGELFAALLFCHLVAILVLSPTRRTSTKDADNLQTTEKNSDPKSSSGRTKFWLGLIWPYQTTTKVEKKQKPFRSLVQTCLLFGRRIILFLVVLPYRVSRWSFLVVFGFVFNRKTLLFCIYCLVWTYLSRLSRQKALQVQM